jgi:hypothetical protein
VGRLLVDREVVRLALMRATIHLVGLVAFLAGPATRHDIRFTRPG